MTRLAAVLAIFLLGALVVVGTGCARYVRWRRGEDWRAMP